MAASENKTEEEKDVRWPLWFQVFTFSRVVIYLLSHEPMYFLYKSWHSRSSQFGLCYPFYIPRKGLSSPVFIIKVLAVNTFGCYSSLSHVNECATMPSVNNVTKWIWQINKTQDFPNFHTIFCAGIKFS